MVRPFQHSRFSTAVLLLTLAVCLRPAMAEAPAEEDWHAFNRAAIHQHAVPRYENLSEKAGAMRVAVQAFCDQPGQKGLDQARKATVHAIMAWQAIQHVQFGPVTYLMRNFGLQYWPDKKGIGARQLRQALKLTDTSFDPAYFNDASASVKGFPALEKLLFDAKVLEKNTENPAVCALATGIADNIFRMSSDIEKEWTQAAEDIEGAGEESEEYEMAVDASTQFLKALVEPVEMLRDDKLNRVLGESAEKTRWKRSEFWRSRQSLNALRVNVQSLQHLYSGWDDHSVADILQRAGGEALAAQIEESFKSIAISLSDAHEPPIDAITPEFHAKLTAISELLRLLQHQLLEAMQVLNIQLGFNSRDGD